MKRGFYLALLCAFMACTSTDDTLGETFSDELIIGVNTQRVFQTKFHPGLNEDQIIERVANLINTLKFNSIRIGGTASFGGTFDANYMGFGWAKYLNIDEVKEVHNIDNFTNEPFNYNIIALKTAQRAGVSVWIDFHRYMTKEDIDDALNIAANLNVKIAGLTRDNEPYIPKRAAFMAEAYADLRDAKFRNFSWPAMSVIEGLQPGDRADRQQTCVDLINTYRNAEESIEIHSYYPKDFAETPKTWIKNIITNTRNAYQVTNDQIMLGEWSGKNQETFTDEEISLIISSYLEVLQAEKVASYYQILGSNFDEVGLYNFEKDQMNRGAEVFMNR